MGQVFWGSLQAPRTTVNAEKKAKFEEGSEKPEWLRTQQRMASSDIFAMEDLEVIRRSKA